MARLRVVAGVLGIISLIIPWTFYYSSYYYNQLIITFTWIPEGVTFLFHNGHLVHTYSGFLTSFPMVDLALSGLGLVLILAGSVVLFASRYHPRVGGILLLVGAIVVILDYAYYEFKYGHFGFIPVGMVIGLLGGILGVISKPVKQVPSKEQEDNVEKLLKLKSLMESGVITKEEFEAQKNKLLQGSSSSDSVESKLKELKSLLDSGAINQSEYDEQKSKILGRI